MTSRQSIEGELMRLEASAPRRLFAIAVMFGLGGLVAWLALSIESGLTGRLVLLGIGGAGLWQAERLRRGTRGAVVLTRKGLFDGAGEPIALLERIVRVDRGTFAFKPANGFLVVLDSTAARAWVPGLWWRAGRRVGIGGVTSGGEARAMADRLTMLMERD